MQYGYKKKLSSPLDLVGLFQTFATMPAGGIFSDEDWISIDKIANFDETVAEVWIILPLFGLYIS